MVQRIAGKDSASSASDAQGPKRQEERAPADRAAKFRDMLGPGAQREAAGQERAKNAGRAGAEGAPGAAGATAGTKPNGAGQADPGGAGATGRSGPGTPAEVAAAARDLQAALDEIGVKATQVRGGGGKAGGEDAGGEAAALGAQLASAMGAPSWGRPEGPTRVEAAGRMMPAEMEGMEKMHRLLIGQGPQGAEARLSITDGPLAGAQIHLKTGPGGVQAAVSTSTESSRQTLVSAMEEVARRMKDKGHRLSVQQAPPPTRPEHSGWPPDQGGQTP